MKTKGSTRFRTQFIRVGFVGLLLVVVGRVYAIQEPNQRLQKMESSQWLAEEKIQPMRGTIYDASGDRLAFDAPAYDLDIYVRGVQQAGQGTVDLLAKRLAPLIGASPAFVQAQLNRKHVTWLRMYPYLVHVSLGERDRVLALFQKMGLQNDINPYKTYTRVYPDGTFASQVIGFVDQTHHGAAGIELQYDRYLTGKAGQKTFLQDSMGNPLPFNAVTTVPVQNGDSVYLTINPAIQHYAEQALAIVKQRFSPKHAAIIVSNPSTGAILAMATLPNYNPAKYWMYPAATLDTNWAISAPFEPGSTFKVFTLTGALATHSITLNQTYQSGVDYVNGVPIRDWNLWGWGRISYRLAMIYSSNVGFIHIGQAEGVKNFYSYFARFGLNQPTGIDLPGEGTSIIYPQKNLNPVDFATMTFGQGVAVTPIQQVAGVGAVANGGQLVRPYLVQKIVAPNGKIVYQHRPVIERTVASRAIMNELTNVMIQDVNLDPLGKVNIPGYNIAGKTGTAQIPKPGGGYIPHMYNLSFVGFVPAHHPAMLIFATVSQAHHAVQYGDWVASPAARYVMRRSLQYLRIPPHGKPQTSPLLGVPASGYVTVPNVTGRTVLAAEAILKRDRLQVAAVNSGGRVTKQFPFPGTRVATGVQVVVASDRSTSLAGKVRVPNFRGMPMIEAVNICSLLGLQPHLSGEGYVVSQALSPGRIVPLGTGIGLQFAAIPVGN